MFEEYLDPSDSTIYALSSGSGKAGVAVFRISGAFAFEALERLTQKSEDFTREPKLRWLYHPVTGEKIDRALILMFQSPASFTGEDVVELHVHGGIAIKSFVLDALSSLTELRAAKSGEFVRRAYHNQKMNLAEVEGLGNLLDAETIAQLRFSQKLIDGTLEKKIKIWQDLYLKCIALIEATIDFSDEEDIPVDVFPEVQTIIMSLIDEFQNEIERSTAFERVQNGVKITLFGAPNVGKSSLLNALIDEDRCIVSEIAGTTRDTIEVRTEWDGNLVILKDTAGIRETSDEIESEGIRRSLKSLEMSDICLVLHSQDTFKPEIENISTSGRIIFIETKIDQYPQKTPDGYGVSVVDPKSVQDLKVTLKAIVKTMCDVDDTVIGYARHRDNLTNALRYLENLKTESFLKKLLSRQPELLSEQVRESFSHILNILSLPDTEDILGQIFSSFCVGK